MLPHVLKNAPVLASYGVKSGVKTVPPALQGSSTWSGVMSSLSCHFLHHFLRQGDNAQKVFNNSKNRKEMN